MPVGTTEIYTNKLLDKKAGIFLSNVFTVAVFCFVDVSLCCVILLPLVCVKYQPLKPSRKDRLEE